MHDSQESVDRESSIKLRIGSNRLSLAISRHFWRPFIPVPSERISLEDKVRAFDKEVDNRGIKIISQGQADDG